MKGVLKMKVEHLQDLAFHDGIEDFDVRVYLAQNEHENLIGVFVNYYDSNDVLPKSYYCAVLASDGQIVLRCMPPNDLVLTPNSRLDGVVFERVPCRQEVSRVVDIEDYVPSGGFYSDAEMLRQKRFLEQLILEGGEE